MMQKTKVKKTQINIREINKTFILLCQTINTLVISWLRLIFFFLFSGTTVLSLLRVLPLDATGTATTERRLQREVNVLLAIQTNDERWDVYDLFAHTKKDGKKNISRLIKNLDARHLSVSL